MGPDGDSGGLWLLPFPLFLNVGVGIVDELTQLSEGFASPVAQLLDSTSDLRGSGVVIFERPFVGFYFPPLLSCWPGGPVEEIFAQSTAESRRRMLAEPAFKRIPSATEVQSLVVS